MRVLVTNPEKDILTRYLHVWTDSLLSKFANQHDFIHLDQDRANRKETLSVLNKRNIDLVLFNGHGSDEAIEGQDEIIFNIDDVDLLKDKTVHTLACQTAKTLGPAAKHSGVKDYIGYDEDFIVIYQEGKVGHPEDDETAALFLDPAFAVQDCLLTGKTGSEAVDAGKEAFKRSILKALNSDIQSDDDQLVAWLWWDQEHLVAV